MDNTINNKIQLKATPNVLKQSKVDNPELSVIVPIYNTEKYVGETILSILKQGGVNFEVILVNDASPDNALEVALSFNDPRITVISLDKNCGEGNARNTGVNFAKADWLCFIDSDDLFVDEILLPYFHYIKQYSHGWGYGSILTFSQSKEEAGIVMGQPFDLVLFMDKNIIPNPQIVSKTLFLNTKGYPANIVVGPDYDLSLQLIEYTDPLHFPKIVSYYRRHSTNISKTHPDQKNEVLQNFRKRIEEVSANPHVENRRRILRKAVDLLSAIYASNYSKILEHSRFLYNHNIDSFVMDYSVVKALIAMGKFRAAFNVAFKWIKKISCGVEIGPKAQEWAVKTAIETAIYLNDYSAIGAILPLANLLQKQAVFFKDSLKDTILLAERVLSYNNTSVTMREVPV